MEREYVVDIGSLSFHAEEGKTIEELYKIAAKVLEDAISNRELEIVNVEAL